MEKQERVSGLRLGNAHVIYETLIAYRLVQKERKDAESRIEQSSRYRPAGPIGIKVQFHGPDCVEFDSSHEMYEDSAQGGK